MDQVVQNRAVCITLTGNVDITGHTDTYIMYKKPNGQEGMWDATSTNDTICELTYAVPNDVLDEVGIWGVKIKYVAGDGRKYEAPRPYRFRVIPSW